MTQRLVHLGLVDGDEVLERADAVVIQRQASMEVTAWLNTLSGDERLRDLPAMREPCCWQASIRGDTPGFASNVTRSSLCRRSRCAPSALPHRDGGLEA